MSRVNVLKARSGTGRRALSLFLILTLISSLMVVLPMSTSVSAAGGLVVPANGQLKVVGTQLCNQHGQAIQLRGVSSAGLQWYGEYMNKSSIQWLRDDWGISVIRAAMYTYEKDKGYIYNNSLKEKVKEVVDAAIELGIYVIIDWHVLNDGDPNTYKTQSKAFFNEMATLYAEYPNVIYEICNEPNGFNLTWSTVKQYANEVIPVIRAADPDSIVIVGTPMWSQDVDKAAADKLSFNNVMYACHFYSGTHKQSLRDKINSALSQNAPVFISEWGTSLSTGTGGVFIPESDTWLNFLNEKKISWVNWSLCPKAETSAILNVGASTTGGWSQADLTQSGQYVKSKIPGSGIPTSEPKPTDTPAPTNTPTPTSTPTPTPTPTNSGCTISGYVLPDFKSADPDSTNKGFTVEVVGTGLSGTTDEDGYYEITGVPADDYYDIKVGKPYFLSRKIDDVYVDGSDIQLGDEDYPIKMWVGDMIINGKQDGAINMTDVVNMATGFNTAVGDSKYKESSDFNLDGAVNMKDVTIIAAHFNKSSLDYPDM